jgi:hypothetical protein
MWTCPKCGERLEDQFDSCWRCAPSAQLALGESQPPQVKLKWFHYFFAGGISYVIPCLGLLVGCGGLWLNAVSWSEGRLIVPIRSELWLFMLVPSAITFALLFPFLRFPAQRRIVAVCLLFAWLLLFLALAPAKTRAI